MRVKIIAGLALALLLAGIVVLTFGALDVKEAYTVGISNGYVGNNWRNQMFEDLYDAIELYEKQGYIEEVIIKNAGSDVNNQIEQIKHLINSDVDLLLVDPNTHHGLNDVLEEAYNKGILVVVFDQSVSSEWAVQLSIDQKDWGRRLADWMVDELDGDGNVVIMEGVENQPCNDERLAGMLEVLNAHPKMSVIARAYGDWDQAAAKTVMTELIATYPSIDGVLTQDGMALGILQAYESTEADLPVMTGETMVAFMEKSMELAQTQDYRTYALTNPPGIGASALSLGLVLLNDESEKIDYGRRYYYPVEEYLMDSSTEGLGAILEAHPGTYYLDDWMTMDEIRESILMKVN